MNRDFGGGGGGGGGTRGFRLIAVCSAIWKKIRSILIKININVFCFVPIFDRCNQQKAIKVKLPTTNYLKVSIMLM